MFDFIQVVCNGHGVCDCGECNCHVGYKGKYCESCPVRYLIFYLSKYLMGKSFLWRLTMINAEVSDIN